MRCLLLSSDAAAINAVLMLLLLHVAAANKPVAECLLLVDLQL